MTDYMMMNDRAGSHVSGRVASGVLGLMLTSAATFAGLKALRAEKPLTESSSSLFKPVDDWGAITVKPAYAGGGATGGVLMGLFPKLAAPSCLFAYTAQGSVPVPQAFESGYKTAQEGWLYGARLEPGHSLAYPTGQKGDVVKGTVRCFESRAFADKLAAADLYQGYSQERPNTGKATRGIVSVIDKNGFALKAYWYYQAAKQTESAGGSKVGAEDEHEAAKELLSRAGRVEVLSKELAAARSTQLQLQTALTASLEKIAQVPQLTAELQESQKATAKLLSVIRAGSGASQYQPVDGMEAVLVRPGPSAGFLQRLSSLLPAGLLAPSCLFSYPQQGFLAGAQAFESGYKFSTTGRLYGVQVPDARSLALVTGLPSDAVDGLVVCFDGAAFAKKLNEADVFFSYNPDTPKQGKVRRSVVSVIDKNGFAVKAYWYYQLEPAKAETVTAAKLDTLAQELAEAKATNERLQSRLAAASLQSAKAAKLAQQLGQSQATKHKLQEVLAFSEEAGSQEVVTGLRKIFKDFDPNSYYITFDESTVQTSSDQSSVSRDKTGQAAKGKGAWTAFLKFLDDKSEYFFSLDQKSAAVSKLTADQINDNINKVVDSKLKEILDNHAKATQDLSEKKQELESMVQGQEEQIKALQISLAEAQAQVKITDSAMDSKLAAIKQLTASLEKTLANTQWRLKQLEEEAKANKDKLVALETANREKTAAFEKERLASASRFEKLEAELAAAKSQMRTAQQAMQDKHAAPVVIPVPEQNVPVAAGSNKATDAPARRRKRDIIYDWFDIGR